MNVRSLFRLLACALFVSWGSSADAASKNYFVARDGEDSNSGTLAKPFRTIRRAIELATPGTTIFIRAGRYHESVDLSRLKGTAEMPITITAFKDEPVTLDGTRPIADLGSTGWTRHRGRVYRTVLDEALWQLFDDGELMMPARWPNAFIHDGSVWNQALHWGRIDNGKSTPAVMVDQATTHSDLAKLPFSVTGAIAVLNVGSFRTFTRSVVHHLPRTRSFSVNPVPSLAKSKGYFFLEGKLEFLDAAREWFYAPANKTLYVWTTSGERPGAGFRGKVQDYAIHGNRTDHVRIADLRMFATAFRFTNSTHVTIQGCEFQYSGCSKRMLGSVSAPLSCEISGPETGTFASVIDCTFSQSECHALYLSGAGNRIENCLFESIDWSCSELPRLMATIYMHGDKPVFRRNTARISGASEFVVFDNAPLVELNDVSEIGLVQNDGAIVQLTRGAQPGSETRYNWFRNTTKNGARFDAPVAIGSPTGSGGLLHHNVAFNNRCGLMVKGDGHRCFHNTTVRSSSNGIVILDDQVSNNVGSVTRNNAAEKLSGHRSSKQELPGIHDHNWNGYDHHRVGQTPPLRDPDNLDFRPRRGSELIDGGVPIEEINKGFVGSASDIGAYEFGESNYWIPGRQLDGATTPVPPNRAINVKTDADLMWLAGKDADAHRVYFGSAPDRLEFRKRQTNNIFSPGRLTPGSTCYWRVDEVTPSGTITGPVWTFVVSGPD